LKPDWFLAVQREGVCTVTSTTHWRHFIGEKQMRNMLGIFKNVFMALSALCFAVPAFAQGGTSNATNWVAISAGFSMAIASAGCGIGQGRATASATEALARNPSARAGIQFALILGLALIESLALYTLVIIFAKVK
jgi:F-type H+-transporting ATPase subunit c